MKYPILIIILLFGLSSGKDFGHSDCTGPDCRMPAPVDFKL